MARYESIQFGIWIGDTMAGVVGFHRIDWNARQANCGYWLGPNFEGQGIMTNAVAELLDRAFREVNLQRVEIRCAVDNARGRAIPGRLGFREEGTLPDVVFRNGKPTDGVVYGLLAQDWSGWPAGE